MTYTELVFWDPRTQGYTTLPCESTTESTWSQRFVQFDKRWRNVSNVECVTKHLTLLVKISEMMTNASQEEIDIALDLLEDIELQYLDIVLYETAQILRTPQNYMEIDQNAVNGN